MTLSDKIEQLLNTTSSSPADSVSAKWVEEMLREHPAFILPGVLLVKRNPSVLSDDELRELKLHLLLNCPDPSALADTVNLSGEDWANIYPAAETPASPSTESAISTFLDAYGSASDSETALLEQLIFNPARADYFADDELEALPSDGSLLPPELRPATSVPTPESDETPRGGDSDVSVVTIQSTPDALPEAPEKHEDENRAEDDRKPAQKADDSLLSESLAKIFIKQHRYERAFEIISNLSLNFPEKSVYFADQLRFLQKLIKNRQYQQQNK